MSGRPDERESWVTPKPDEGSGAPDDAPAQDAEAADSRAREVAANEVEAAETRGGADAEAPEIDQAQQYRELAQRVQADFENYRKRVLREQTQVIERATEGLIEALLPVLDSFELALTTLDDAKERVRKGVELVYAEFLGVLEKHGLERIETDGKPFDPNVHEAVLQEEGDGEPVVAETMRTGYALRGRVLRPAMVKVTR